MEEADSGESLAKGLGLGDLSPSFRSGIINGVNYSHEATRGPVTKGLTSETVDTMSRLAGQVPGGINVTSGYRSKAINDAVGGVKASNHMTGQAFDLSTSGMTDQQKRDTVERGIMAGAVEVGTYGKDSSLHMSTNQRFSALPGQETGGITAAYNHSRYNYDQAPGWFKDGIEQSRLAPTPTERPVQSVSALNPSGLATPGTEAAGGATPLGTRGFADLSSEQRSLLGKTLAGEIDLSKTDLNTVEGQQEAMGILSTAENRLGKYKSVEGVIGAPKQYSTWNNETAAKVAEENYAANPAQYDSLVSSYIDNPDSNLGFTSYHANTVNPGWSTSLQNKTTIGPHTFGTLSEYGSFDSFGTQIATPDTISAPPSPALSSTADFAKAEQQGPLGFSSLGGSVADTDTSANSTSSAEASKSDKSDTNSSGGGFGSVGAKAGATSAGSTTTNSRSGGFAPGPGSVGSTKTDKDKSSGYSGSRSDGWT